MTYTPADAKPPIQRLFLLGATMKAPASIVLGTMAIDPAEPSLFCRTAPAQFYRDEVRLDPPRDVSIELQSSKSIIDSGRSLYLEMSHRLATVR